MVQIKFKKMQGTREIAVFARLLDAPNARQQADCREQHMQSGA
jgi:hypothetical protein